MIKRLYFYCKLSTAIERIIPYKQLLLNPVGKTNDPRENKSFVFAKKNMYAHDLLMFDHSDNEYTRSIRKNCKMLCFSTDYNDFFGFEYSRMWALYGENHKGICLALNIERFQEENKLKIQPGCFKEINYYEFNAHNPVKHIEIDYDKLRNGGTYAYIIGDLRPNNIDYFFFTKNKEWESEHEYRLLYISDLKEDEYCTINSCLDAIYLGIDFNMNYLPSILKHISNTNIYSLDYKEGVRLVPDKQLNKS